MTNSVEDSTWRGMETVAQREAHLLAPYAMHSVDSTGRKHPERQHAYRGPYQRDRDRIVHSTAYRRLAHKTQVFTGDLGDYHRTRLTHTMEVASIARTLARALRLNEDLVEALALLHDIGHPPFGHAGEDTLNECLADFGGFSHNQHALCIVEELETRYRDFPGLNLSLEVLGGQHVRANKHATGGPSPLLEVQVVDAADSVAYDAHDADDALALGLITAEDLWEVPMWREASQRVSAERADLEDADLRRTVVHQLIDWQVGNMLETTAARLAEAHPQAAAEAQDLPVLVQPSERLATLKGELESFLFQRVYRHDQVLAVRQESQSRLVAMFNFFVTHPDQMGAHFQQRIDLVGVQRSVGDYIAGMTDRFAQKCFEKYIP